MDVIVTAGFQTDGDGHDDDDGKDEDDGEYENVGEEEHNDDFYFVEAQPNNGWVMSAP